MPVTPLTQDQADQLALHCDELLTLTEEWTASCEVGDDCVKLYEVHAANLPGGFTNFGSCINGNTTMSVPEKAALAGRVNAMTAVQTGDELASDIANEMLGLFEEKVIGVTPTGRDVTQTQLP